MCNEGRDFFAAGSAFQIEGHFQDLVFSRLPSVIHLPADADHAAVLRWAIDRFAVEVRSSRPGRALMLSHLLPIMLLQILRGYLATAETGASPRPRARWGTTRRARSASRSRASSDSVRGRTAAAPAPSREMKNS